MLFSLSILRLQLKMKEETTDQGHKAKIEAEVEYLAQTPLESEEITALPQAHKDYLLSRHGTLDLDPIPDMNDADPYNWPQWKVHWSFASLKSCRNVVLESHRPLSCSIPCDDEHLHCLCNTIRLWKRSRGF